MALGDDQPPPDPLSTLITGETTATEMEEIRKALAAKQNRMREETERQRQEARRLELEKTQLEGLTEYHSRRRESRVAPNRNLATAFNNTTTRQAENRDPGTSRVTPPPPPCRSTS